MKNALFMLYSPFSRPGQYDILHYHLFHGRELENSDLTPVRPLQVTRSGRHFPDVTIVGISLVVSSSVRSKLSRFEQLEFRPVSLTKLVDCAYPVGDFSYYHSKEFLADPFTNDPETLMDRLPDVPQLHAAAKQYYEVVAQDYDDIKPKRIRSGTQRIRVQSPDESDSSIFYDGPFSVTLDFIQKHPIFQRSGDYFLNGECAEIIVEFVDSPYFKMPKLVQVD